MDRTPGGAVDCCLLYPGCLPPGFYLWDVDFDLCGPLLLGWGRYFPYQRPPLIPADIAQYKGRAHHSGNWPPTALELPARPSSSSVSALRFHFSMPSLPFLILLWGLISTDASMSPSTVTAREGRLLGTGHILHLDTDVVVAVQSFE